MSSQENLSCDNTFVSQLNSCELVALMLCERANSKSDRHLVFILLLFSSVRLYVPLAAVTHRESMDKWFANMQHFCPKVSFCSAQTLTQTLRERILGKEIGNAIPTHFDVAALGPDEIRRYDHHRSSVS